jgi:uncharacterized protein (TIGR02117 family)
MLKFIKILFRGLKWIFAVILSLTATYMIMAVVLSLIPVNRQKVPKCELEVYILSNGVHLEMVLPVRNEIKDWTSEIMIDSGIVQIVRFISFGWGDRQFFINTPEWADLTVKTAVTALFLKSPAALHVDCWSDLPVNNRCKRIPVSKDQYKIIVDYINDSFKRDSSGNTIPIRDFHYDRYDSFYEAENSYSLFFTCNTWTNRCLKVSGLKACLWTPFDKGTLFQYRN